MLYAEYRLVNKTDPVLEAYEFDFLVTDKLKIR